MTLIVSRWRMLLAFAVLGSALALAYRGEWALASAEAAIVLLRFAVAKLRLMATPGGAGVKQ